MRNTVLVLHILAIISWMAGILYLYRILIYASERGQRHPEVHDLLATRGERLYRYITVPAMAIAWLAGLALIYLNPAYLQQGWLHVKLTAVIALTGSTIHAIHLVERFKQNREPLPKGKTLRFLNEVPTLLMIVIVIMVIARPF